jgi:hypothetical protein
LLTFRPMISYSTLARGLGWFSIALGIAEIVLPRRLGRLTGLLRYRRMLPSLGLREIAAGIGVLAARQPAPGLWARVAGDGMDLGVLAGALTRRRRRARVVASIAAVLGVTALDALCAWRMSAHAAPAPRPAAFSR